MGTQTGHVMTLANGIIGVSVLAMPFCFKQCGILLSILMLILSSIISRLACHFLLKSAIMARRRTFEFLAYHAFGPTGKMTVELGIIGFLMGTCIAFFVVVGDLGPAIIAKMLNLGPPSDTLRTSVLISLSLFCVLPLGLLRKVDSLSSVCAATIGFYFCLVVKIIVEAIPHILSGDWISKVEFWNPSGILQCLPIFSMALFCQTQLFELYDTLPNASLDKMNSVVRVAVNICTSVYIFVGVFGYIAFSSQSFSGNILMSFTPSTITDIITIGFVMSIAFSFPLVIFPCRASLYSLLFKRIQAPHENISSYIPESRFKWLTFLIVSCSLGIGLLIPSIELVLGLVGSTIGVMICILFPATCFICMSSKNTNERLLAQAMIFIGVLVMVLGTYANLYAMEEGGSNALVITIKPVQIAEPFIASKGLENDKLDVQMFDSMKNDKVRNSEKDTKRKKENEQLNMLIEKNDIKPKPVLVEPPPEKDLIPNKDVRVEPPQPVEPEEPAVKNLPLPEEKDTINGVIMKDREKVENEILKEPIVKNVDMKNNDLQSDKKETEVKSVSGTKVEEVNIEAIKKEEQIIAEEKKSQTVMGNEFLKKLEEKEIEQKKVINEAKQILKEIKEQKKELIHEKELTEQENIKEVEQKLEAAEVKTNENINKDSVKNDIDPLFQMLNHNLVVNKEGGNKTNEQNVEKEVKKKSIISNAPLSYQLGLNNVEKLNGVNEIPNRVNEKLTEDKNLLNNNFVPIPLAQKGDIAMLKNSDVRANQNQNNQINDSENKKVEKPIESNLPLVENKVNANEKQVEKENELKDEAKRDIRVNAHEKAILDKQDEVNETNTQQSVNKKTNEVNDGVKAMRRDILSDGKEVQTTVSQLLREKREADERYDGAISSQILKESNNTNAESCDKKVKNATLMNDKRNEQMKIKEEENTEKQIKPEIKIVTKLTDPELPNINLNGLELLQNNFEMKPMKRDLKSFLESVASESNSENNTGN